MGSRILNILLLLYFPMMVLMIWFIKDEFIEVFIKIGVGITLTILYLLIVFTKKPKEVIDEEYITETIKEEPNDTEFKQLIEEFLTEIKNIDKN